MSFSCEEERAEPAAGGHPDGRDVAAKLEASDFDLEGIEDDDGLMKDLARAP